MYTIGDFATAESLFFAVLSLLIRVKTRFLVAVEQSCIKFALSVLHTRYNRARATIRYGKRILFSRSDKTGKTNKKQACK